MVVTSFTVGFVAITVISMGLVLMSFMFSFLIVAVIFIFMTLFMTSAIFRMIAFWRRGNIALTFSGFVDMVVPCLSKSWSGEGGEK